MQWGPVYRSCDEILWEYDDDDDKILQKCTVLECVGKRIKIHHSLYQHVEDI